MSRPRLTPEQSALLREREMLQLSRVRVLHELEQTRVPQRRATLQASLAFLDAKLAGLEGR